MTTWKAGDLGRFRAESVKRPRFEVIDRSADKASIIVWYGGSDKTTLVPIATFRRDCVKDWVLAEIVPPRPSWLQENAEFEFPQNAYVSIRQAEVQDIRTRQTTHAQSVDVRGEKLQIRRIRNDYASCMLIRTGILVMTPLTVIIQKGLQRRTRWDIVEENLVAEDRAEEDADLLKDF